MSNAVKRSGHGAGVRGGEMFKFRPHEYVLVGLDTDDGPEHYLYQQSVKDPPPRSMVASIVKYGVIKPVEFERDGDRNLIVDGRTRIKAAREALDILREAAVREGQDPDTVEIMVRGIPTKGSEDHLIGIMHVSNAHRRVYKPSEEAEAVQSMLAHGVDEATICLNLRLSKAQLKARQAILSLAAPVRDAIDAGRIRPTAGVRLAALPKAEQIKELAEMTADGARPTVQQATDRVRRASGRNPVETPSQKLRRVRELFAQEGLDLTAMLEEIRKIISAPPKLRRQQAADPPEPMMPEQSEELA